MSHCGEYGIEILRVFSSGLELGLERIFFLFLKNVYCMIRYRKICRSRAHV